MSLLIRRFGGKREYADIPFDVHAVVITSDSTCQKRVQNKYTVKFYIFILIQYLNIK